MDSFITAYNIYSSPPKNDKSLLSFIQEEGAAIVLAFTQDVSCLSSSSNS